MNNENFEFRGSGIGYCWIMLWTYALTVLTFGLYFPWACSAQQRWITSNTYINKRQLAFLGTGMGFFFSWLVIMVFTAITFGLYLPWAYCKLKRWEVNNTVFADSV